MTDREKLEEFLDECGRPDWQTLHAMVRAMLGWADELREQMQKCNEKPTCGACSNDLILIHEVERRLAEGLK